MDGDDFAPTGDTDDDGLEGWIEDAFGTRDEKLVHDDGLEEELDRRRVVLREAYRQSLVAAEELEHELERAIEDAEAASDCKRELLQARAVRLRERYE